MRRCMGTGYRWLQMDVFTLGVLGLVTSFVTPYIWTRNPKVSLLMALTDALLMVGLASLFGLL